MKNTNNLQYNGEIDYKYLKDIFNYKFILFSSEKTNILNIIPENCNIKELNINYNCLKYKDYMISKGF